LRTAATAVLKVALAASMACTLLFHFVTFEVASELE
jgi:hypothetical protein